MTCFIADNGVENEIDAYYSYSFREAHFKSQINSLTHASIAQTPMLAVLSKKNIYTNMQHDIHCFNQCRNWPHLFALPELHHFV